ncbi:tetraacyldisaccharide 4'-kinase [Marinibaculum pumilum]|uniref:Tetraacyldisaccharide 4'-kinase n=1 Tax=Marinibaculum pumilum TaxID=1766165 RepID=A0ABV7KVS4_9PROT
MRTPEHWRRRGGLAALLAPLGWLYGLGARLDRWTSRRHRVAVPVISIGNLTAGGTGKTPVAIALAERLTAAGIAVHILSRGYGGRLAGPVRVDPGRHGAADTGDEPLLLARAAPTWVARDRVAAARAAIAAGAQLLLLDDGHQHYRLARDCSLLVADEGQWLGNGRVMPAGPLREPLSPALARADALLAIADPAGAGPPMPAALARLPRCTARFEVPEGTATALRGQAVFAFAGIGRPEKFFATLRALGARPVAEIPFPDHAPYTVDQVARLLEAAAEAGARPVTTEKDHVRLPADAQALVTAVPVRLQFDDPSALERAIAHALARIAPPAAREARP